ncbi:APC family permease [Limosilactobacillus reuteri]|uniref:Amino acid permease n=2 Tax=Limosilactobacillus reuteri TaxID=1598 RepID=A0A0U5JV93_LIMRT|nr:amino acid permease [Limosilactobacillus reuteri]MBB1071792.1 amino acid permease [Limosilactobacillus reuteri]MCC4482544.1 amino acid permease [Limosilactobacillus reuteri]MCC4511219.1 amino acid permease [Limosilactobacillus reuteri]MCC4512888.1 amino acid permease [Limosilactobacillus reuteri]MQB56776.1 amino acid permease [Limosilactobacillus reuteri]
MKKLIKRLFLKQNPRVYEEKDAQLTPSLRTRDLIGLGTGMVVGTAIFTLPGIVAAEHTGPAVPLAFIVAAIGAGLSALAYAETSSVLPFAGSAFSWINVLFGEFFGWIAGWALLAEYFISVAFVASGWSAYMQGFLGSFGIKLPHALTGGFDPHTGSYIDILAAFAILIVGVLISRGVHQVSRIENIIVSVKLLVILMFIVVGVTAIHPQNYVPFLPAHQPGTTFGGWQGILAGTAQIFIAYVGFDAIAANTAETINPQKTMPRGLIGTLLLGTGFFIAVSLVLVGMFKYSRYANNAEPAAWALRQSGHYITANLLSVVAIVGIFSALIAILLASSRLIYAFGRDGLLPKSLGQIDDKHVPNHALWMITFLAMILGSVFPFTFLATLVSAGTLVAFIFVSLGIYALRPREGVDLPEAQFKMPLYPVLPAISAIFSAVIFWGLNTDAKILMVGWFVIGLLIYFIYGIRHSIINKENH